jgi:hypothetical protein
MAFMVLFVLFLCVIIVGDYELDNPVYPVLILPWLGLQALFVVFYGSGSGQNHYFLAMALAAS